MKIEEMVDLALGYGDGVNRIMRETGKTLDEIRDILLTENVEECPNCHLWAESSEMTDDNSEPDGYCDNCRRYDKKEEES